VASKERVFTHPSQLNDLSVIPFLRTNGLGTLRLGGSIIEHRELKRWESELNRYYYACGCDTSAKGLIIGLLAGSVWAGYSYFQGLWGGGGAVGVALSFAIGGAIVGKIIGLFRANEKLKQTVEEIQGQWQPEEQPKREHWTCG
jgi:hypothetical protein